MGEDVEEEGVMMRMLTNIIYYCNEHYDIGSLASLMRGT